MSEINIYQRVNSVMRKIEYVQKDKEVNAPGQQYKAVTHDMVTAVVRKHLVENGIVIRLEQKSSEMLQKRDVDAGVKMHLYSASYDVHFVNIDKPEDFITVSIEAHAADNGDKAPGKAASYATKYAILKLFSLETGEDDESRTAETVLYTDQQKEQLEQILMSKNALDMVCFSQTVGPDIMIALNGSFRDGEKSAKKKAVKELTSEGWQQIDDIAFQISERIESKDPSVFELTSELNNVEKRLVANKLKPEEIAYLKNITAEQD